MKIAVCQLLIEGGEPLRNFARSEKMLHEAKEHKCDLALFPETMDFAWTHPSGLEEADTLPGVFSDRLCRLSKQYQLYICAGLTEKTKAGNFNSAVLINSEGEIQTVYRKINLLEVEFPYYLVGQALSVINSPWGKIGINICSDNYSDALSIGNVLARMGAVCILSPASWTVDHHITEHDDPYKNKWKKPLGDISKTFEICMVSATGVGYIVGGPYEGKKMIGQSLISKPDGSFEEGVVNEFSGTVFCADLPLVEAGKYKGTLAGKRARECGFPY